jgi:hypothetical protein
MSLAWLCPQCGRYFDPLGPRAARVLRYAGTWAVEGATLCSPPCAAVWRGEAE